MKKLRFPIRFKILIGLLFVVTTIVSIITFTMANLFHSDKSAYIKDLISVVALHTGEEASSLINGYNERIKVFSRVIYDHELSQLEKSKLLEQFFGDFSDFVSVTTYRLGKKKRLVDKGKTHKVKLTKEYSHGDIVVPINSVSKSVRVRSEASKNSAVRGKLGVGESAEYIRSKDDWHYMRLKDGTEGYVHQDWTRVITGSTLPPTNKNVAKEKTVIPGSSSPPANRKVAKKKTDPITIYDSNLLENVKLKKSDIEKFHEDHPLPLEKIIAGHLHIENATMTEELPALRIAQVYSSPDKKEVAIVSTIIKLDSLLRLTNRSKVFEVFITDASGTLIAHSDMEKIVKHGKADWLPELKTLQMQSGLSTTVEYPKEGADMVGGFTKVGKTGLFAGAQIPKAAAFLTARDLLKNLIVVALSLLIFSAILGMFWSRLITRPLEKLSKAADILSKGDFDINIDTTSRDEIGDLAHSFNDMASELDRRERALKDAQSALVQSEKMSAFGQLGAGIAHEVKNPLAGILGYTQLSKRKVDEDSPLHKNLEIIEKETKRCKEIIDNLMKFARQETVEFEATDVNKVAEDAIAIVNHQLTLSDVKIEKELSPDLPFIKGNANQVQQVLMNFMINAQQAMEGEPGTVGISTALLDSGRIEIKVEDNGPGMSEEVRNKIFEPFFTTKPTGKGTGLGLAVSFGIIKDHNGEIEVKSDLGKGSLFVLTFPTMGSSDSESS